MLINAMCLYGAPQVIEFSAMFSDMTEALANSMTKFAEAVSGQKLEKNLEEYFPVEFDDLVEDFIEQVQEQSAAILAAYDGILNELKSDGHLKPADDAVARFKKIVPALTPLDEIGQPRELLAYVSILESGDDNASMLENFIECYMPLFEKMEEDSVREEQERQKLLQSWFEAAENNELNILKEISEKDPDLDIESENKERLTALAIAAKNNNLDVACWLLSQGASPVNSFSDYSPISIAMDNGHNEVFLSILESGHEDLDEVDWKRILIGLSDEFVESFRLLYKTRPDDFDLYDLAEAAINKKSNKILALIIDFGLDVNEVNGSDPLSLYAVMHDDVNALKILFDNGADINVTVRNDKSLLECSIENDKSQAIETLIERGCKFNTEAVNFYFLMESLHKLSVLKGWSLKESLEQNLFDLDIYDYNGKTLLHYAVDCQQDDDNYSDKFKLLRLLIEDFAADINQTTEDGGLAAINIVRDKTILDYLIQHNADLNISLSDRYTVLSSVSSNFGHEGISALIEAGIEPNSSLYTLPLLHYAIQEQQDYVNALIENGADINCVDKNGHTVLQKWIGDKQRLQPILQALALKGADFNLETKSGLPMVHGLFALYDLDTLKELMPNIELDLSATDANGNNTIMQAVLSRNINNVIFLAEHGVDANKPNDLGITPLMQAIYADHAEMVTALIKECNVDKDFKFLGKNMDGFARQTESYDSVDALYELGVESSV